MSAGCPHNMPTPASCIECMAEGPIPTAKLDRDGWPFAAHHEGVCGGCTEGIAPGERIVRMSDGRYRHIGACERNTAHG